MEGFNTPSKRSFLETYLHFNLGNECPSSFHMWSALSLLSILASRKLCVDFGQLIIYPNIYVCLIGPQGNRKSTAKDIARSILEDEFPTVPRGPSVTTKEALTQFMASDECLRAYTDENNAEVEYRPMFLVINELKNFLSVNPQGMLDFLTDIYDRKFYDSHFKNKGTDIIVNPYIVLLACETDDWIKDKMKANIISGGFARRMIPIFEEDRRCQIPRPFMTPEMEASRAEVIQILTRVRDLRGTFTWTPESEEFFDKWYCSIKRPDEKLLEGFYSSIHIQVLKVTMLITAADYGDLIIRKPVLETAIALVLSVVPNMTKLYANTGMNVLAAPTDRLLELIQRKGGLLSEKEFLWQAQRDMDPRQAAAVVALLEKTEKIVRMVREDSKGTKRVFFVLKEKANELVSAKSDQPGGASVATTASPDPSTTLDLLIDPPSLPPEEIDL